jgi:GT2 family glycosyltransferase
MIAIVIVNHNTCTHLKHLLETAMEEGATEIVVVDNASTDQSVEMVRHNFPSVITFSNTNNLGYGAAANQGILHCSAPYVLLLNSDTCLQRGCLKALSSYLDNHLRAAIVGPRLINPEGLLQPSCFPFPTLLPLFLQESRLEHLIGLIPLVRDHYLRTWLHIYSRVVPWILGAALAIRREAFEEIGGFDTSFYMYAEEVDLCYRLAKSGWETHFTPDATIVHEGGASTRQHRATMSVHFFISILHFYRKHYPKISQHGLVFMMKVIILARWLRDLVRLRLTSDHEQQDAITQNLIAWQYILLSKS